MALLGRAETMAELVVIAFPSEAKGSAKALRHADDRSSPAGSSGRHSGGDTRALIARCTLVGRRLLVLFKKGRRA
jgi:hypothetical protein